MAIFESLSKYRNTGLLILTLSLGVIMMAHGLPKIMGGPDGCTKLGGSMKVLQIDFLPMLWYFMAAASEGIGGFLLILGLLFRPVNTLLVFTMIIAALVHLPKASDLKNKLKPTIS